MAHVVIIGASSGGLPAAYDLRATLVKKPPNHGDFQFRHPPVRAVQSVGGARLAQPPRHDH